MNVISVNHKAHTGIYGNWCHQVSWSLMTSVMAVVVLVVGLNKATSSG